MKLMDEQRLNHCFWLHVRDQLVVNHSFEMSKMFSALSVVWLQVWGQTSIIVLFNVYMYYNISDILMFSLHYQHANGKESTVIAEGLKFVKYDFTISR